MDLYSELAAIVEALGRHELPYALCGGLAVALHGHPRFTKDVDLLVLDNHLAETKRVLAELGYVLEAEPMTFGTGMAERTVHRVSRVHEGDTLTVDLILLSGALRDVWEERVEFNWEGRIITAVSAAGLVRMKRIAGRPQDLVDIEALGVGLDPSVEDDDG